MPHNIQTENERMRSMLGMIVADNTALLVAIDNWLKTFPAEVVATEMSLRSGVPHTKMPEYAISQAQLNHSLATLGANTAEIIGFLNTPRKD